MQEIAKKKKKKKKGREIKTSFIRKTKTVVMWFT